MSHYHADDDSNWLIRYQNRTTDDPRDYILKHPGDIRVAEQIHCYPRAAEKFPGWHKPGMLYTRLALEQSSGEIAALHKAQLLHNIGGRSIADLTGGLGMDTLAFASYFPEVHYSDPDPHPLQLARNNHQLHNRYHIQYFNLSAEDALDQIPDVDWIYLDPSRRNPQSRVFSLADSEPDVLKLLPKLRRKSGGILLKLSPLYDLRQLQREIPDISNLFVVSVRGEVKEILALIHPTHPKTGQTDTEKQHSNADSRYSSSSGLYAICLPDVFVVQSTIGHPNELHHSNTIHHPIDPEPASIPDTPFYLHIPDPAIIKTRLTDHWSNLFNLRRISPVNDFAFSSSEVYPAGSKTYRIDAWMPYKPRELSRSMPAARVHIHRRDFHSTPEELYKKLGFRMGDDAHLFFTTWPGIGQVVLISHCRSTHKLL